MLTLAPAPMPLLPRVDTPHPERAVQRGELVKVRHGVYAATRLWRELAPWDRYLCRVHAVALVNPDAVFCMESAAALLGMPIFGDPVTVHVLVPPSGASRQVAGVRTHRATTERTIIALSGALVTSPSDTAVDLARARHHAIGLAAADAVLRLDPATTAEVLVRINEARSSSRGRDIARWPLSRATVLAETAIEAISRAVLEWLGFPRPELQVAFRASDGVEHRPDFLWPDSTASTRRSAIAGDSDGDLKYDGRYGDARTVLKKQSERDVRLLENVRSVTHWGWDDAVNVEPLRKRLVGVGLKATDPEHTAGLHSLRRALVSRPPHATGPSSSDR